VPAAAERHVEAGTFQHALFDKLAKGDIMVVAGTAFTPATIAELRSRLFLVDKAIGGLDENT
jgi:hypothetical protein